MRINELLEVLKDSEEIVVRSEDRGEALWVGNAGDAKKDNLLRAIIINRIMRANECILIMID